MLAKDSDLSKAVITRILDTKAYMEGRSFMIDVNTKADVDVINKLVKIKMYK